MSSKLSFHLDTIGCIPVNIGQGIVSTSLSKVFSRSQYTRVFVITNNTIQGLYPHFFDDLLKNITVDTYAIPDGEEYKNQQTVESIYNFLFRHSAQRDSLLIAFGGGVVGDIVGFVASTFMRGIPYIQIPTTLLAQVDSCIGGKTGINYTNVKNAIGTFYHPISIIIDTDFLSTLSTRNFTTGFAEILKYALINEKEFFELLQSIDIKTIRSDSSALEKIICNSCQTKVTIVQKDEKENGCRAILNFGHTIGHALESITDYQQYTHGEAILGGMDFSCWWSHKYSSLSRNEFNIIRSSLKKFLPELTFKNKEEKYFCDILAKDKKNRQLGINFVALETLGRAVIYPKISVKDLYADFVEYSKEKDSLIKIH